MDSAKRWGRNDRDELESAAAALRGIFIIIVTGGQKEEKSEYHWMTVS